MPIDNRDYTQGKDTKRYKEWKLEKGMSEEEIKEEWRRGRGYLPDKKPLMPIPEIAYHKPKLPAILGFLGWATFITAIIGFVASLWLYTPILANLYSWGVSTAICICLAFMGWGLAHYDITNIWYYYFKPAFILLLELGCIATIIYASYSLVTKAGILPFEGNIALFTVASIILACLGWITRHKVITTLLAIPFIIGIAMVILQAQGIQLQLPEALKVLLTLWYVELYFYLMFAPLYLLGGVALIVFIIWLVVAIIRDIAD